MVHYFPLGNVAWRMLQTAQYLLFDLRGTTGRRSL